MEARTFTITKIPLLIILAVIFLIVSGCSTSNTGTVSQLDKNQRADQTFSFYNDENGDNVRWEVNFDDGKISSVYKDGQRIPDNEIEDYRDMIYDRLDRLQDKSHHIIIDMDGFKSDMHKFKVDMHTLKKELKDKHYKFKFDNKEFKEGMKELSRELSKLKDKKIRIEFDSDKFKKEMDKLKKDIDIEVNIDMDDLKEELDKMNDEMDKHRDELSHITIDLSGLDVAMSDLDKNLDHIKINLNGLDVKIKNLNEFIDKAKDEMVKDKLIKDKDELLNLDIYENGMKINGKEVPPELYEKYKKMYEDHFGETLSDDNHFRIIE